MWKFHIQFHSHCSRIYDIKTLCSKHKINCKGITLHTNTTIYRTTRGIPSCAIVSVQKHYCQLCNSQCRTLPSSVQVLIQEHYCQLCNIVSAQEHYCQLYNTVSAQEQYCQLCKSPSKNTTVSCTSVPARTLLSAVQHSVNARTLLSAVQQSVHEHFHQWCKC
jgi:hypothetical protein